MSASDVFQELKAHRAAVEAARVGTLTVVKVQIMTTFTDGFEIYWREHFTTIEAAESAMLVEMAKIATPAEWEALNDHTFILDDGHVQYQTSIEVIRTRD